MEAEVLKEARPGLRERKKQKTREAIINAALELFAQKGYEHTTIAEIAEAADVSPRTIFAYFPSKEEILFCEMPEVHAGFARALRARPAGVTTLDVVRELFLSSLKPDPKHVLRKRILASDEALVASMHARFAPFEELLVESIATDLDADPEDIRPRIVAAAFIAAFRTVHDPAAPPEAFSPEHAMALLDDVLKFLRGGLDAFRKG